jgi:hypothetical protein
MAEQMTIEGDRAEHSDHRAAGRARLTTAQMKRHRTSDHRVIRELLIHAAAFLLAVAVGAVVLWHYYWFFEWNTDDAGAARDAFLASIVVVGGIGPAITMLIIWLRRMMGAD